MEIVKKQYYWIFLVIVVMLLQRKCDCCLEEEKIALLQINSFFNNPFYLSSWGLLNVDCCNWEWVECNKTTNRVISLQLELLSGLNVKEDWYLNASLFLPFQQLKNLSLAENYFNGCVRNEGFERLSKLTNLELLDLGNNNFNNTILSSISGLSSLKYLYLWANRLQGTNNISGFERLSKLSNLEFLDLGGNNFNNSILSSISGLSSLKYLYLYDNNLQGTNNISELQKLRNLEVLDLGRNQLTNSNIISILKGLSSLKALNLGYNQLEGQFNWKELHNLKSLEVLSLSGNSNITKFMGSTDEIGPIKLITLYFDEMIAYGRSQLLESLRVFPYLKVLSLRYSNFTNGARFGSAGFYNWSNLKELYLDGSFMDENFLLTIEATMPSLKVLSCTRMQNPLVHIRGVCELQYLQELDLGKNDLHGILPPCLSNLTSLKCLDLYSNHFVGDIITLSPLINLEYLNLYGNLFQIPISLSPFFNHSKLNYLNVGGNNITAVIEDQNSTPKFQLETLYLSGNRGSGGRELPNFLYYQHNLQLLDLSHNKIRGELPFWLLDNNTQLESLYLANNSLSGPMKLPVHSHMNLSSLDISYNYFHGHIPEEFGEYFPTLGSLYMSTNIFNGNIPSSFRNMSLLKYLILDNNSLSGQIPNWMGSITSLEVLNLSENNISGTLPLKFSPPSLIEIHLSKNNLKGSLRDAFYNSLWLVVLDLSHNNFEGHISELIGDKKLLSYIILSHNNFEGELPVQLCKLDSLSLIDFSHNNLSGTILPCINCSSFWFRYEGSLNTYRMQPKQNVEFTNKDSLYSYQPTTLELFSGIDLSSNKFIGQIPIEIGNLGEIQMLNLSHNRLIGPIPQSFSNLKRIESLDLSYNNLEGRIPPQLTQLTALEVFSVAYNNLSGRTPERVNQFGTFEPNCYEGNPFLCGLPLSKLCNPTISAPPPPTSTSMDKQEDNGFVDMDAFRETFVAAYIILLLGIVAILYINPYWRQVWFYYAELVATICYFFLVDNIPFMLKLGIS